MYRSTSLEIGYSPAQVLFGRQLRTTLPLTTEQRKLKLPDLSRVVSRDEQLKQRQQVNHNAHHAARSLPPLPLGSEVFLADSQESGEIVSQPVHRPYVVTTPSGNLRHNWRKINPLPSSAAKSVDKPNGAPEGAEECVVSTVMLSVAERSTLPPPQQGSTTSQPTSTVVTRSGHVVHLPAWFADGQKF